MAVIDRKSIKGNKGNVRFKRQINKILTVVACCAIIIILYEWSWKGSLSGRNSKNKEQFDIR